MIQVPPYIPTKRVKLRVGPINLYHWMKKSLKLLKEWQEMIYSLIRFVGMQREWDIWHTVKVLRFDFTTLGGQHVLLGAQIDYRFEAKCSREWVRLEAMVAAWKSNFNVCEWFWTYGITHVSGRKRRPPGLEPNRYMKDHAHMGFVLYLISIW
jgi:hypothetical protein